MFECPFTPEELARYAAVTIDRCFDLRPGELLQVFYEPEHRPLVIALAEAAFSRGLRFEAAVRDPLILRAEVDHATEEVLGRLTPWRRAQQLARTEPGMAALYIDGQGEPDALAAADPARLAVRARHMGEELAEFYRRYAANLDTSGIVAYPTAAWAALAYPELPAADARRTLAQDLLSFCRIGAGDV
jgi:aminopeptidase